MMKTRIKLIASLIFVSILFVLSAVIVPKRPAHLSVAGETVTVREFDGCTIGGVSTNLSDESVRMFLDGYFGIHLGSYISYERFEDAKKALDNGLVSGIWAVDITAAKLTQSGEYVALSPAETPGQGQTNFSFGFAFAPSNRELRDQANAFLAGVPLAHQPGGTLTIGVTGAVPPLEEVDAFGNANGSSLTLAKEFASYLGRKSIIVVLQNDSALVDLMAGRVDMLATYGTSENHSLTETKYLMSDGYQEISEYQLIVRKEGAEKMQGLLNAIKENLISGGAYRLIFKAAFVSLAIFLLSALIAGILSYVLLLLSGIRHKALRNLAGGIIFLLKSTPVLLLMLVLFYGFFSSRHSSFISAIVAIGFYGAGMLTGEFLDKHIEVPHSFNGKAVLSLLTSRSARKIFILQLQWTTIVGYLGVNDITQVLKTIGNRTLYPLFSITCSILFYLIVVLLLEWLPCSDKADPKH
ncbi:MAG: transporter substrate-binding domain-containing protein [Lachnospiraceae bacterium]|nr:transporter substrate-binding domain-containing protein [Lachnospiraceae bacterium]